jgi:hypothetical protein
MAAPRPRDEKRRFQLAEEVHAHELEILEHCAGALLLDQEAEVIEGAGKHPGLVVGPESSGQQDRAEAAQVEPVGCVGAERLPFRYLRPRQSVGGTTGSAGRFWACSSVLLCSRDPPPLLGASRVAGRGHDARAAAAPPGARGCDRAIAGLRVHRRDELLE